MRSPAGNLIDVAHRAVNVRHTLATSDSAEPAVYVHGHTGSSQNWTDLAAQLADRFDGWAMDLPGFGCSEPAPSYGVAEMAEAVAGVVEAVGHGPVHLLGNSYGGTVCLWLAAQRPSLVRTLTLISPAMPFLNPRWSRRLSLRSAWDIARGSAALKQQLSCEDTRDLVAGALAGTCADTRRIAPARLREMAEEARQARRSPWRISAETRSFRAMLWMFLRSYLPGPYSLRRLAAGLTVPTLVLWGRLDRVLDVRLADRLARTIPGAQLATLPGVGHLPHLEATTEVAVEIRRFLQATAGSGHPAPRPRRTQQAH